MSWRGLFKKTVKPTEEELQKQQQLEEWSNWPEGRLFFNDSRLENLVRNHQITPGKIGLLAHFWSHTDVVHQQHMLDGWMDRLRLDKSLVTILQKANLWNRVRSLLSEYIASVCEKELDDTAAKNWTKVAVFCVHNGIELSTFTQNIGFIQQSLLNIAVQLDVPSEILPKINDALQARLHLDLTLFCDAFEKAKLNAWNDESAEKDQARLQMLYELVEAVEEAIRIGDMTSRSALDKFPDGIRETVGAFNGLLDAILEPMQQAIQVLEYVRERDLTKRISDDFIGDLKLIPEAMNPALEHLSDALRQVALVVNEVEEGASKMADSSQALSAGATEQASSLEEIRSTVDEITAQARQNSDNARSVQEVASQAHGDAEEGNTQMEQMSDAMSAINEAANEISRIIKAIEEIAFQTNMLSLNAAVEAARAGVHGKGFAVVAEEVRSLAGRSAKAAKETAELIERAIARVEKGVTIAENTESSLTRIVDAVDNMSRLITDIAEASSDQTMRIEQVNEAIGQIDGVTQSNAATAEQSAAVSEQLAASARVLKDTVSSFRISGLEWADNGNGKRKLVDKRLQSQSDKRVRMHSIPSQQTDTVVTDEIVIDLDDSDFGNF